VAFSIVLVYWRELSCFGNHFLSDCSSERQLSLQAWRSLFGSWVRS
jgi:hypothetical protein